MIDGLKILDTFEFRGAQGFIHTDFSISSIIKLEQYSDLEYLDDDQVEAYDLSKEKIISNMVSFGKGAMFPFVRASGGSLYQIIQIPVTSIEEELSIIEKSNGNKTVFRSLLQNIIEEEKQKLTSESENLKRYETFLVIRTYLSPDEEKAFKFKVGQKKYDSKKFEQLYTENFENNFDIEILKERLFQDLSELFQRHRVSMTTLGAEVYTKTRILQDTLEQDIKTHKLLDILSQCNVIRLFFGLKKLTSVNVEKQVTLQIFREEMEILPNSLAISTGRKKYILSLRGIEAYHIYQGEWSNVIVEDKKTSVITQYEEAVLVKKDGDLWIVKKDLKESKATQVPEIFKANEYEMRETILYKYLKIYTMSELPDTITTDMGGRFQRKLNENLKEEVQQINVTINVYKSPVKEVKSHIYKMVLAWKFILAMPSVYGYGYDEQTVQEKVMALKALDEYLRRGDVSLNTSQIYITTVSYSDKSFRERIDSVMGSSEFGFSVTEELYQSSIILFGGAIPLTYNTKNIAMEKELLLTNEDLKNLLSLNVGSGQFSLTRPGIIGISENRRINYIDSYDPRIEAPNGVVVGATGSGKSFTKIYELIKLMTMGIQPLIVIIDKGGSFMNFVKIFGGRAVALELKNPKNNINPFVYTEEFRRFYLELVGHRTDKTEKELGIIAKFEKADGTDIIYMSEDKTKYTKDENGLFHIFLEGDISPQQKSLFFTRILQSMTRSSKKDIKKIIADAIKHIVDSNEKKYKQKKVYQKNSVMIRDDKTNELVKNLKETVVDSDIAGHVYTTDTYTVEWVSVGDEMEFNGEILASGVNTVIVKSNELIGYQDVYENCVVDVIKNPLELTEEVYYFTVEDVQLFLKNVDPIRYEEEVNVLNNYVDLTVYGNLFNGPPALNFDNELIWTVDMGEETPDDLVGIILQAMNIVIWNSILAVKNKARRKMIIFDEVHQILSNTNDTGPAEAIGYLYRTIRKHGGGIHVLTQASADIFKDAGEVSAEQLPIFSGIKTNAMYKYIIGINEDDKKRAKSDFQLKDKEVAEIVKFSEKKSTDAKSRGMLYVKTKAFRGFLNVKATPTVYAIATTMKEEKNLQEAIEKRVKANEITTAFFRKNVDRYSDSQRLNILTMIKIIIFKTFFPRGISNVYGENSRDAFLKRHVEKFPDGSDQYSSGLNDFIMQGRLLEGFEGIIALEFEKLEIELRKS